MKKILEILQEIRQAFKEHGNFDLNNIPVDVMLRATATGIREAKKLIKRQDNASYLLAYTLRHTKTNTYSGSTTDRDHYEVFCEPDAMDTPPKDQAKQRLNEIQAMYEDEDSTTEIYSWNICRIEKTNEHYQIS